MVANRLAARSPNGTPHRTGGDAGSSCGPVMSMDLLAA